MTLGASAAVATDSGGSAATYEVDKATALTMLTTLWQRFCNNCDQLAQRDLDTCPWCGKHMDPIAR